MTRTLPGSMSTNVAKTVTNPIWLLEITFSTINYYSTREQIAYDSGSGSNNYLKDRLDVRDVTPKSATFQMANDDRVISALALQGQIRGNLVRFFLHYEGDTLLRFVGEIDSFEIIDTKRGSWVKFKSTALTMLKAKWPYVRIGPPALNHLPQAGLQFQYGETIYILEDQV